MKKILHNSRNEKGFSLIEVIVGITMIVLTSVAALTLGTTALRTERYNEKRLVAYNLGQQVMEEIRRQRDSGWDDLKSATTWTTGTATGSGLSVYNHDIDTWTQDGTTASCAKSGNDLKCSIDGEDFTIQKTIEEVANFAGLHGIDATTRGSGLDDSMVRRVTVNIVWDEQGATRNLKLVTLLTDWRPAI